MDRPVNAKTALLQALITGDGYGLELIDRVRERTSGRILLNQGSVYPALRDLEREGLIRSYESQPIPERGGRPRIYYSLTAEGRKVAQNEREVILGLVGLNPVGLLI